jgi:hypothetical protein
MAVKIADNAWYQQTAEHHDNDLRELVKERYKALVEKQRIMFTTFHQSSPMKILSKGFARLLMKNRVRFATKLWMVFLNSCA